MQREKCLGISMPVLNTPFSGFGAMATLAEEAGFDSVWDYEFYRNPFTIHAVNALSTNNITLATGLAAAAGRSPFEMANAAADVDELSNGRMLIGMSTGSAGYAEFLNGSKINKPVSRLREYITCMRQGWRYMNTGDDAEINGEFYSFAPPPMNPWGLRELTRPEIPVYLAGLRPNMMRLAGEMANGVLGFIVTPKFAKEQWLPYIAEGAVKAGRLPSEIETTSLVICSVSEDREEAMRLARINVGLYTSYPVGTFIADFMGLTEDRNAVVAAMMSEGPSALEHVTSDALVKAFSIAGTPDECHEQLAEYQEVLDHLVLHTPYVPPITAEESTAAFQRIAKYMGPNR
jgi:alkanesulfonate monooxygenase SsuD/methylene tetrahydromethanopterin reductase-like flavin-dependent oxidoreductase (luciferase family)